MTLEILKKMVSGAGFTNSPADWEDDFNIYAFSVESLDTSTYGHPAFTANYNKTTGWLAVDGQRPTKVG